MGFFDTFRIIRKRKVKKVATNCAPPSTGDPKLDGEFISLWMKGSYKELYELAKKYRVDEEIESKVSDNDCHHCKMLAFMQVEVRAFAVMKYDELLSSNQSPEDYTINVWTDYDDVRGEDIPLVGFICNPKRVHHFGDHLYKKE